MRLILASASPRRQEILRNAGFSFEVDPAHVDETPSSNESGRACAERLAREKAQAVATRHPEDAVLGADTVVVVNGEMFGKPHNDDDAARMLSALSGHTHEVITGVCLVINGEQDFRSQSTKVSMVELSLDDIRQYVATREPMDKAGAYAIQGLASRWVKEIDGNYFNVVGLPIELVYRMLKGISLEQEHAAAPTIGL